MSMYAQSSQKKAHSIIANHCESLRILKKIVGICDVKMMMSQQVDVQSKTHCGVINDAVFEFRIFKSATFASIFCNLLK